MGEGVVDGLGRQVAVKAMAGAGIGHSLDQRPGLGRQTGEELIKAIGIVIGVSVAALDEDRRARGIGKG